jgi:hypothetical protein
LSTNRRSFGSIGLPQVAQVTGFDLLKNINASSFECSGVPDEENSYAV